MASSAAGASLLISHAAASAASALAAVPAASSAASSAPAPSPTPPPTSISDSSTPDVTLAAFVHNLPAEELWSPAAQQQLFAFLTATPLASQPRRVWATIYLFVSGLRRANSPALPALLFAVSGFLQRRLPALLANRAAAPEAAQRVCLALGDLARYGGHRRSARKYYYQALQLLPADGAPQNQLAVLANMQRQRLPTVFHYACAALAVLPSRAAANNLHSLFLALRSAELGDDDVDDGGGGPGSAYGDDFGDDHDDDRDDDPEEDEQIRDILRCFLRTHACICLAAPGMSMHPQSDQNCSQITLAQQPLPSKIKN